MFEKEIEMKQHIHTLIMGSLTVVSLYLYFLSTQPLQAEVEIKQFPTLIIEKEEQLALNYLNHLRTQAGLIPFESHPILNQAAKNHANYLSNHLTFGHEELPQYSDYTGKFASNRIVRVGFSTAKVIENVSANNRNYKESIDGLFGAIYHRQAFLDFRPDLIGIGVSQNQRDKEHTAFVYDLSVKALEEAHKSPKEPNQKTLNKALQSNKNRNKSVVIYPFNQQQNVPPAFFDELPDPLPQHRVSGFPISISFNPSIYRSVKLLKFKLYNSQGKEVHNTLTYTHDTDINQRLGKFDFVLFPLQRLQWNHKYTAIFLANINNKIVKKQWSFHTQKFNLPFYTIPKSSASVKLKVAQPSIFYFPPTSKIDLLSNIAYPENFDIDFIDKNTIKLTLLHHVKKKTKLLIGRHIVHIISEN